MNTQFNYKLKLLTNKKDEGSGPKLGVGYVISEGVCDFRSPCTSRNHVIFDYVIKKLQNICMVYNFLFIFA